MTPGNDSKKVDFLPHDLVTEILSWLPLESLMKFKTVCKLWRDTIQQHNFTHLHMSRCSIMHPKFISQVYTVDADLDAGEDISITDASSVNGILLERCRYTVKPDSDDNTESLASVSSVNGILLNNCISTDKYRIRNPSTKHILHLPIPEHFEPVIMFMRFVDQTKEYKLVSYHLDKTTKQSGFGVLTIGTDSSWRPLHDPTNSHYENHGNLKALYVDDVLYMFGLSVAGDPGLICLDMVTEQFKEVTIPSCLFPDWENMWVVLWNGKLSIAKLVEEQMHAWILEDHKKSKWSDQKYVISLSPAIFADLSQLKECVNLYISGNKLEISDRKRDMLRYDYKSRNKYIVSYRASMVHFRGMHLPPDEDPHPSVVGALHMQPE